MEYLIVGEIIKSINIINYEDDSSILQGCPKGGPRAGCGPQPTFICLSQA